VPAIETVCDGDPFSFGLCNAYCEALDCESATPLSTPRACTNLLRNYVKKSRGQYPACVCPCTFDLDDGKSLLSHQSDPYAGVTECGDDVGPDGEPGLHYKVEEFPGVYGEIFYYFNELDPSSCNVLVQEFDQNVADPIKSERHAVHTGTLGGCQAQVEQLCPD